MKERKATVRRAPKRPAHISQEDWDSVDSPELAEADFAKMRPARKRGRPPVGETPKAAVKLRLDVDVLEAFKADGPGWQTRINEALRRAVGR